MCGLKKDMQPPNPLKGEKEKMGKLTTMTAFSILEIDSEISYLLKYGLIFKKDIEILKRKKLELYENTYAVPGTAV